MSSTDRIGWIVVLFLACLALTMWFCSIAQADEPSLSSKIVSVLPTLSSKSEGSVDAGELSEAIGGLPKVTKDWAALVLAVGCNESAFSARIAAGNCKKYECDGGRAWGVFQVHKTHLNAPVWGSPNISDQVREASRVLRAAFYHCSTGKPRADWVARTLSAYAGRNCDDDWPGLKARVATFNYVRARL